MEKFIAHLFTSIFTYILNGLLCWDEKVIPHLHPLNASKDNFFMLQKSSWIRGRPRKHKTQFTIFRNGLFIKNKPFTVHIPIDIEEFPQTFFLHCKLCYHYFEIKLLLTSASTEIIPLLDSSCSERILSNLVLSHSISIALYETVLLVLKGEKKKTCRKRSPNVLQPLHNQMAAFV